MGVGNGETDSEDTVAIDSSSTIVPNRNGEANSLEELAVLNLFAQERSGPRHVASRPLAGNEEVRVVERDAERFRIGARQLDVDDDRAGIRFEVDVRIRFEAPMSTPRCEEAIELE
ncbi:MAG TPA: hypothetical protein VE591_10310 [Candidatus Acidoferrum sp.]|nr:hypothetical protein [Candidatus Acidoferrum sp.]